MRRWFSIVVALCALTVTLAAGPAGAAGLQPRSQLRNPTCHNALDPQNRSTAVTAVMRPLAGNDKLQLKFELLSIFGQSSAQTSIRAGNLGRWLTPRNQTLGQLPADVWSFRKTVFQLNAPGTYRFRVSFRWIGAGGRVLGSAVRYTKPCRQHERRPDLMVVTPIAVVPTPDQPGHDTYTAVVSNAGATATGPFQIAFVSTDPNTAAQTITISGLPPKPKPGWDRGVVSFVGPLCASASQPEIIADFAHQVDDLNRLNNSAYATCPSSTGA
jgi:hypothetical protein